MTLIAPGTVSGHLTLWARCDTCTGTTAGAIYSYPITIDANGQPALSNPPAGQAGTPVTATSGTIITGVTLPAASYPVLVSPGAPGTSYPGLYAEDPNGNLCYYPGQSTSSGAPPLIDNPINAGKLAQYATQLS